MAWWERTVDVFKSTTAKVSEKTKEVAEKTKEAAIKTKEYTKAKLGKTETASELAQVLENKARNANTL